MYRIFMHIEPAGPEKQVYSGKLFEIIHQPMRIGDKTVLFETARRPPGTRLIIKDHDKILITKEYRTELRSYDYRLPGGKVFDTIDTYQEALTRKEDILKIATLAARKECEEETGIKPKTIRHFATTHAGATVHWDLFYFVVEDFDKTSQKLELGEDIHPEWKTLAEVETLCIQGQMHEDRSVGVLLRFLKLSSLR